MHPLTLINCSKSTQHYSGTFPTIRKNEGVELQPNAIVNTNNASDNKRREFFFKWNIKRRDSKDILNITD